ncbi:hypothetical protein SCB71_00130 [Herbiconiux sp. KACC 21604]|uniref:hypothetical protein n=1 Tax=unclassified Herbiconiux TaxID=2618217 RepID=UPI001492BF16|nr:hypothetical protein [Herbiconiux sp. SALV-R1]QJU55495.1 hypothetical protein HL652_18985 [Herbiconiux sp. SALV-R1]WPO86679.1 hypothetical protein SCB71_00130 [Herbiconiux sp. KACC 21604]
MDALSLLPSVIVFGTVGVAVVSAVVLLRRRARRSPAPAIGRAPARESLADLSRRAGIALVRMDDAVRAAEQELEFARAEFGDAATTAFADAVATAKRRASEAFALQQRLDDSVPDTEQEQRDWNKRILALGDTAVALVDEQTRGFDDRRRAESSAAESLRLLRARLAEAREDVPDARRTLDRISVSFDRDALGGLGDAPDRAEQLFGSATTRLDEATRLLEGDPLAAVAGRVRTAGQELADGRDLLADVRGLPAALERAGTAREAALVAARDLLGEAARLRDEVDDQSAATAISTALAQLTDTVGEVERRRPPHPNADLDLLAAASAPLETAVATARSAQRRLDAAREALAGALQIAESHLDTARRSIAANRGRVGADARTRLASAERELGLARLEADPVAALDGARRAATLATDADALAHYDALHG